MEIDGRSASSPQSQGLANQTPRPIRGATPAQPGEISGNPAFIIDLGPNAVAAVADGEEPDANTSRPGKSADSPAHRARAYLSQFLEQNGSQDSPFKSFGQFVSQLAQGRSIEEIFSAFRAPQQETDSTTESTETVSNDEVDRGQNAPVVTGEPAPTLLETFLENEEDDGKPAAT